MKLRSVNTSFWSDPWIESLTPSEKLIYLYLITNEKTNMLGIYEVSIKKICFDTGIDKQTVSKALEGFQRIGKVKYIDNFIILTKYLKHQSFNTNMKKSAIDCYNSLPENIKFQGVNINKDNPLKGFETLLNHYGILSKVEVEVEEETEEEEEKGEKKFVPPTLSEVQKYFDEKGYSQTAANKAFEYYDSAGWKDSKGQKIKNWKQKMIGVWFRPEHEKPQKKSENNFTADLYKNL